MPRPKKFYDDTGLCRVTLKKGSDRQPGGERPHAQYVQADGKRVNAYGLPVKRTSPGAFAAITWDFDDEPSDDHGEGATEAAVEEGGGAIGEALDFDEVAALAFKSATLHRGLQSLDAAGFALLEAPSHEANQLLVSACRILVDPALAADHTLTGVVAREVGRALAVQPKVSARGRDRASFARDNALASVREEGEAILFAADVRREILDAHGPDIGLPQIALEAVALAESAGARAGAIARSEAAEAVGVHALAPDFPDARARYERLWQRVYDLLTGAP
jgi:hypothetical protein